MNSSRRSGIHLKRHHPCRRGRSAISRPGLLQRSFGSQTAHSPRGARPHDRRTPRDDALADGGRRVSCSSPRTGLKHVLYNQFHDILAGTCIVAAYEDTRDQLGASLHAAKEVINRSVQSLARNVDTTPPGNTVIVLNPLPWRVRQTVLIPPIAARGIENPLHAAGSKGRLVAIQPVTGPYVGSHSYALTADVPGLGYRSFHIRSGGLQFFRIDGWRPGLCIWEIMSGGDRIRPLGWTHSPALR